MSQFRITIEVDMPGVDNVLALTDRHETNSVRTILVNPAWWSSLEITQLEPVSVLGAPPDSQETPTKGRE